MTNNDYATHYTKEKGGNWYQFPAYVKIDKKDLLKTYVSKNRPNIVIGTLLESFLVHTILFSNGTTWDCNSGFNSYAIPADPAYQQPGAIIPIPTYSKSEYKIKVKKALKDYE